MAEITIKNVIREFCTGDSWRREETVEEIPPGRQVVKAWLTVKKSPRDSDANAIFQIDVTEEQTEKGRITDTGSGGTAVMYFDVTKEQTRSLKAGQRYYYDIQVLTNDGITATPVVGPLIAEQDITRTSA